MAKEAAFGPTVPEVLPPDYGSRSQGLRYSASTGFADAVGDFAKVAGQAVVAVDQKVQGDIRKEVETGFDDVSREFGVDSATLFEQGIDTPNQPSPYFLKDAQRQLDGLSAQYRKGQSTERHYYARLNSMVRQLRSKYPGYREQIDNIVSDVTGVRPANALQAQLFNEWEATAKEATTNRKLIMKWGEDGLLPPNYETMDFETIKSHVFERGAEKANRQERMAALEEESKFGTVTSTRAASSFQQDATELVNRSLKDGTTAIGVSWNKVQEKVRSLQHRALEGRFVSAEEQAELTGMISQLETELRSTLNAHGTNPENVAYAGYLKKDDRDNAIKLAMEPIEILKSALSSEGNPWGLYGGVTAYLETSTKNATKDLVDGNQAILRMAALNKFAGPNVAAYMLNNPGVESALADLLVDNEVSAAVTEEGADIFKSLAGLDIKKNRDPEKFKQAQQTLIEKWSDIAKGATEGKVTPEVFRRYVRYMFKPETLKMMSTDVTPASRVHYFKTVTSPEVTRAMIQMRDAGDTESYQMYRSWVTTAFKALFREEVGELMQFQIDNNKVDIQFDHKTNTFTTVPNPDYVKRNDMGINDALRSLNTANTAMQELNTVIQSIIPIIRDEKLETADQLGGLLSEMGLDLDVKQTGTIAEVLWEALMAKSEKVRKNQEDRAKAKVEGYREQYQNKNSIFELDAVNRRYRKVEDRVRVQDTEPPPPPASE